MRESPTALSSRRKEKPPDLDAENYFIRDGIVVVPKNAVIPAGFWI